MIPDKGKPDLPQELFEGAYRRQRGDSVSRGRRLRRWVFHRIIRGGTWAHGFAMTVAGRIGPAKRTPPAGSGQRILLTGRFDSDNWIVSHVGPLSASASCSRVWMVSTRPVPSLAKVEGIYPPKWLTRLFGPTPARLMVFVAAAFRLRPDVVGAFHMLINGMVAAVVGPLVGARTMYFCVSGPVEVLDGGVRRDSSLFSKMETPDAVVERRLFRVASSFDMVITMGSAAARLFKSKRIAGGVHVVSGGIDLEKFRPSVEPKAFDVVFVGRLVHVKRVDVLLEAIRQVRLRLGAIRAVVVGDGEDRHALERLCGELGLADCVQFVGFRSDSDEWLRRSRIFALSSDSEGLSLAAIEAMASGLPVVASRVGDLGDLVIDGVNGYLVRRRRPEALADRICTLLGDPAKLLRFSRAARETALRYSPSAVARKWDEILSGTPNGQSEANRSELRRPRGEARLDNDKDKSRAAERERKAGRSVRSDRQATYVEV